MRGSSRYILSLLVLLLSCQAFYAQTGQTATGSFTIQGRARAGGKPYPLKKKRFYLFRGSREANKDLIDRLKAATATSRDCFYCRLKASAEFMQWLKAGDCESVHCREISQEDIAKVPEFQAAYKKGLNALRAKPKFAAAVARKLLVSNLELGFRSGFYDMRKMLVRDLEKDIIQTAMTDNSRDPKGYFTNIPLSSEIGKFVYTNLVPIEINDKSYVWVCEIELGKETKKAPFFDAPESSKQDKNCEVIVRDLSVCEAGLCEQK